MPANIRVGYGPLPGFTDYYVPTSTVKAQIERERASADFIMERWKVYVDRLGFPETESALAIIQASILNDLKNAGLWGDAAFVKNVIATGHTNFAFYAKKNVDEFVAGLPWFLKPKAILTMALLGGAVYIFLPTLTRSAVAGFKEARK